MASNYLAKQVDQELAKLDREIGIESTFYSVGDPVIDVTTGVMTRPRTSTPNILIRPHELNIRDLEEISQNAGLNQTETAFEMRSYYVNSIEPDDELETTESETTYVILRATQDMLRTDWLLFVREKRT